jgi:predicted transcriptional regulator of viral defense system
MPLSTKEYKQGLNKTESFLLSSLARADKNIFSLADAKRIVPKNTKELMHSLIGKQWVLPLKRGLYVIIPLDVGVKEADAFVVYNFVIASSLIKPYYICFWSALNHHGLSDQIPGTTFIATMQAKKPLKILEAEYCFVKLERNKFFGATEVEIEGKRVKISNPEKTIVDCLDHPEHAADYYPQVARSRVEAVLSFPTKPFGTCHLKRSLA